MLTACRWWCRYPKTLKQTEILQSAGRLVRNKGANTLATTEGNQGVESYNITAFGTETIERLQPTSLRDFNGMAPNVGPYPSYPGMYGYGVPQGPRPESITGRIIIESDPTVILPVAQERTSQWTHGLTNSLINLGKYGSACWARTSDPLINRRVSEYINLVKSISYQGARCNQMPRNA